MTYLGIDLGKQRIGIAVSDMKGLIAQPISIIPRTSDKDTVETIAHICTERKVEALVIGVPYSATEEVQETFRSFGEKIAKHTNLPLHEWDETFSTKQAQNVVAFSDRPSSRKKTQDHRDDVAAAIILQEFLDHAYRQKNSTSDRTDTSA